jgi:2,5-diketo-D-gluconate reductase A
METIQQSGRARYIGVSNYDIRHLDEMDDANLMRLAVNEIEFHPYIFSEC